jgi:ferredoxin-NADP reductase
MLAEAVTAESEAVLTVRAAEIVAGDIVALTLASPDGRPLPPWTPGAHVDLVVGEGLVRQYSLCGALGNGSWRIAVLRAPDSRGGSVAVHRLAPGDSVRVRGPRNHFPLISARSYVFVAGGIGITPLLPMIAEVDAAGAVWELHYGGRTRGSMAFTDELARYGDRVHLVPQDEAGLLDLDRILRTPRPGTLVYACGPEPMLAAVEQRCARWLPGSLHVERFAPRAGSTDVHDEEFEVELARSGRTLLVAADRSIFEVVREAGVSVLGSCLEGICGTCETEVIDGDIDHRDSVLDEAERQAGETMMICVSRCRSAKLTLDL